MVEEGFFNRAAAEVTKIRISNKLVGRKEGVIKINRRCTDYSKSFVHLPGV